MHIPIPRRASICCCKEVQKSSGPNFDFSERRTLVGDVGHGLCSWLPEEYILVQHNRVSADDVLE
jgi:hypothetical protein